MGNWACAFYNDCDCGYTEYAMRKSTNELGQTVFHFELVIDKYLISNPNGEIQVNVQIDDTIVWQNGQALVGWDNMPIITENGFLIK